MGKKLILILLFMTSIVIAQPTNLNGSYFTKPFWKRLTTFSIGLNNSTDTLSFSTPVVVPLVIGGSVATQSLTLRSTSGVGTTGADIIFQTGNNGATEAIRILNNGNVGIGITNPGTKLTIIGNGDIAKFGDGTQTIDFYVSTGLGAIGMSTIGHDLQLFVDNNIFRGMSIKATTGNVGINTANPLATFHSNGIAMFSAGTGASLTDSSLIINYNLGSPVLNWYATNSATWNIGINTSDQATFNSASGGYVFDNEITLSSGGFIGNPLTRGKDSFTTTATADTVTITGASVNDIYIVSYITAVTSAESPLSIVSTATGFIVTRPAGTTSGANYAYFRQK